MTDRQLVLAGAAVVGAGSLLAIGAGGPGAAPIQLLAAVATALAVVSGQKILGASGSASIVLAFSAVMTTLAVLDLLGILTDLDDRATYGGWTGLIARAAIVVGVGLIVFGALREWSQHQVSDERVEVTGTERLAGIGGLVVVVAWVGMVTSVWFMSAGQAFGVAAASGALVSVSLHQRSSLPLPQTWRRVLMVSLAMVTVGMALASLIYTIGDWGFLVEFGGIRVFGPYVMYLGGAALLGVAGFVEARALIASGDGFKLDHVATMTLVGIVTLVAAVSAIGDSGGPATPTGTTPTTVAGTASSDGTADANTVAVGPEVPPIDGCLLLSDEEVEQALGIVEPSGFILFGGGEACTWQPFDAAPEEDIYVAVSPANPDVFGEQPGQAGGVSVSDVGELATWFGGEGRGELNVIAGTDIGYALLSIEVARPDVDDATRLDAAKTLAASAIAQLRGEAPEVVEASLCELVSDAEAEELLAPHRAGRAAARDELHIIGPSAPVDLAEAGDTSCKKLILTEIYVEVASGYPEDFEAGADFEGVAGEPVDGVGEEAVWYGAVPRQDAFSAPHEAGILAVRQEEAHLRILLSLPDMSTEDQLEAARRLASIALVRLSAGEARVITIDHTPDAPRRFRLVDNLLAREEAGEWTEGEGLVQTLQMIVGEVDAEAVVTEGELFDEETTGIVNLARVHLAEAPDSPVAGELERLLGILIFSDTQLEEMAGAGAPTASLASMWSPEAAAATAEDCRAFFTGWEIPIGIGQCLEKRTSLVLEDSFPGEYKVFGPAPPLPTAGWQDRHYDLAIEAMEEIVFHYKNLGELPPVNIVFSVLQHPTAGAQAAPRLDSDPEDEDRPCGVTLFRSLQNKSDLTFKQFVAHELAHCLHGDTFSHHYTPKVSDWWDEGLADYLSNTVNEEYAKNNLEWAVLPDFESAELSTGVADRLYDNFIFFQQLSHSYGNDGIFDIISSFPEDASREQQEAALANYRGMTGNYHEFVEKASDIDIEDTSGEIIPNLPGSDPYTLDGPMVILDHPLPFGATRLALRVPDGKVACIEHDQSGPVLTSWRPGLPGSPTGDWSEDMPGALTGDAVVVVTATGPNGEMSIQVEDVSDEPDCAEGEEEPDPLDTECLDICDPSSYYWFWHSLPEAVQGLLPSP